MEKPAVILVLFKDTYGKVAEDVATKTIFEGWDVRFVLIEQPV